jgi:hypothetical protein
MRTGSHLQARFTGQAEKEFTWFGLGASAPLVSMDAERAARQIVEAVRQRRAEVILTPAGQVVSRVAGERGHIAGPAARKTTGPACMRWSADTGES